ncbi:hypothetical protein GO495_27490 [Chitinophaga oryziterrae]|uniref:Uncharacterized protein n=1 Tax=Chitinophaga oryziterrae TaxID=1031224 RepID=A0A6N8JJD0_9BACT|nr:class I lanthipeptide [Chitinophaga oryziterrae]MVT44368.1 hypothetical protein [Chitinophaga oryziterrae]
MKKIKFNPLALDKETIARLDAKQLNEISGGVVSDYAATSNGCPLGGSECGVGGTSTGCGSGHSTCIVLTED